MFVCMCVCKVCMCVYRYVGMFEGMFVDVNEGMNVCVFVDM